MNHTVHNCSAVLRIQSQFTHIEMSRARVLQHTCTAFGPSDSELNIARAKFPSTYGCSLFGYKRHACVLRKPQFFRLAVLV